MKSNREPRVSFEGVHVRFNPPKGGALMLTSGPDGAAILDLRDCPFSFDTVHLEVDESLPVGTVKFTPLAAESCSLGADATEPNTETDG